MKYNVKMKNEYLKKILKEPDNEINYENLYRVYMEAEEYDKAIKIMDALLSKREYAEGYYLLGEGYCRLSIQDEDDNLFENASKAYENAIRMNPYNAKYYLSLGKIQDEVFGDAEKCVENYIKALNIEKSDSICILISEQYYILNDIERSNSYYQKALKLNPENIEANIFQANYLYEKEKNPEEALKCAKKLVDKGVDLQEFKFLISDCLMSLQRYHEALEWFSFMINSNLDLCMGYVNRARVYMLLSKYEEAIQDYTNALKDENDPSYIYYERGLIYCKIKEKKYAEGDLNQIKLLHANKDRINKLETEINKI